MVHLFFYPGATVSAKIIQIGTSSKTTWKGSIRPQTPISLVFFSWPPYQKKNCHLLGVLSHLLSLGFPMVSKLFLRVTNLLEKVESTHESSPCLDVLSQNPPPQVGGGNLGWVSPMVNAGGNDQNCSKIPGHVYPTFRRRTEVDHFSWVRWVFSCKKIICVHLAQSSITNSQQNPS